MCCSNRFKTVAVIGLHEKLTTELDAVLGYLPMKPRMWKSGMVGRPLQHGVRQQASAP